MADSPFGIKKKKKVSGVQGTGEATVFGIKDSVVGNLGKEGGLVQQIVTKKKEDAKIAADAAARKAGEGFAPSEATDEEIAAHKKTDKMPASMMSIQQKTPSAIATKGLTDVTALKSRLKGSNPFGATSKLAVQGATAGTTPKGMSPATLGDNMNFLGSGPNPAVVKNSLFSIRKKTAIK